MWIMTLFCLPKERIPHAIGRNEYINKHKLIQAGTKYKISKRWIVFEDLNISRAKYSSSLNVYDLHLHVLKEHFNVARLLISVGHERRLQWQWVAFTKESALLQSNTQKPDSDA